VQAQNDRGSVHLGDARDEVRRVRGHRRARPRIGDAGGSDEVDAPIVRLHGCDRVVDVAFADLRVERGLQFFRYFVHTGLHLFLRTVG